MDSTCQTGVSPSREDDRRGELDTGFVLASPDVGLDADSSPSLWDKLLWVGVVLGIVIVVGAWNSEFPPVLFAVGVGLLYGSILGSTTLGSSGPRVRVTLEEQAILLTRGSQNAEIPRSAKPRLVQSFSGLVDRNGWELAWSVGQDREKRLKLGPLSTVARKAFVLWLGRTPSYRGAPIEVHGSTAHLTCPFCRDSVNASPEEVGSCSGCEARYHSACWVEFGGCALPSCRSLDPAHEAAQIRFLPERDSA